MTKWTEERTNTLRELAGSMDAEVSRDTVTEIAEKMEVSARSISSKLRKEGFSVEKSGAAPSQFTEEETEDLRNLLEENNGELTYAELAERLGSDHSARAVQGKVLSMEMTGYVRKTPPKEVERAYSEEESDTIVRMANEGKFLEEIAEAVGKPMASVRGKALSLLRSGSISELPKQRDKKPATTDVYEELGDSIATMTVEEIMEKTGKTARGVKTVLTRRKLKAADYDGVARAEKASGNS